MTYISHFKESSLFSYSEEDIAEHYANLAASVIACFSAKFKMEERVKRLNKILHLFEQDKEEIFKGKNIRRVVKIKRQKHIGRKLLVFPKEKTV